MLRLLIPLLLCAALSACGRPSITFALGAGDNRLSEAAVIDEGSEAKVAQIDIRGLIADEERSALFGGGTNPVDDLTARLDKAARDPQVRAVLLRINSPGGTVGACESMYSEVRRFRELTGKPVVACMGEVAASGGFYLALAADEVMAQPSTITGSIGVIIPTINVSAGMQKIGIVSRSIKSGANKDLANPLEPIREEQYQVLQHMVDQFYAGFRSLVLERRAGKFDASRADELLDGRVFTGAEAARLGLVDSTGGIRDAFARAKALAKLDKATLVKYHSEGERPRSAYADAGGNNTVEMNLVKIEGLEGLMGMGGGRAYYLWTPNLP